MQISKRILLKISGESLMGDSKYGLDVSTAKFIANEIMKIHTMTECFKEPKFIDSFIDLRRGRQTKTKHKRNKNKKNKGYSRKKKQGRR